MVDLTFMVLLALGDVASARAPILGPLAKIALTRQQPETNKAKPLRRWPNDLDMFRLGMAEGKPAWAVLVIMGNPRKIERRPDGTEVWDYPWPAYCGVWFKNGVCTGTFYTAGY